MYTGVSEQWAVFKLSRTKLGCFFLFVFGRKTVYPSIYRGILGYRELCNGRNIDFTLKTHCPTKPLFYFIGVAVRFD